MEQQPRMLQLFSSGGAHYAVFSDQVMTIATWREPAVLPQAPASVLGVVNIQGRMLTVLDLSHLLESQQRASSRSHILALTGDEQLALAIDAPGEKIAPGNNFGDPEEVTDTSRLIAGIINHNGDEIRILNVKQLFPTAIQGRERRRRRF